MKIRSFLRMAVLATPLLLVSCHSHKKSVEEPKVVVPQTVEQVKFIEKVNATAQTAQFVSSKLKFTVEYGPQQITLTGSLHMKRDDVIRMQLMAFGFVEAGRLEFTKDYVLIMDRINKQYLKAPYNYVDFLRNSGINFYTLQALFWNELFVPGKQGVDSTSVNRFTTTNGGEDVIINLDEGKMSYSWLADQQNGRIKMANIAYRDSYRGNTQLNWDYRGFDKMGNKLFPSDMGVTLTTPEKEVKLGVKLTYIGNESDWETRTTVSDKYREVTVDEILRRVMAL
ncbi:MAG: DUF4292 domain-containing protein [Prevotella sp.]|nr:DUF4292 domain-containing protein [Prevotella sp.]